jgi:hypothetical protein
MNTIYFPACDLPVIADVDVLVVGGGPAGVGAAFAARRAGKSVLVIEQFNCLGGVATAGGHGHISIYCSNGTSTRVVGGIADELAQRLVDGGYGFRNPHGVWFEVEGLKRILDTMAKDEGVQVLYYTQFCESIVEDGVITGAVIQNKGGRQAVRATMVVDCTGDGDVAASAGAPFEMGRPGDGRCQPMTLMFTIGGVDYPAVEKWRTSYQMTDVWLEAQRNGDMEPFQTTVMGFWWTPTRPDQVGVNFTHIIYMDATRAEDLTYATMEGRRQAYLSIDVFRKYVRGMEHCYMVSTPNTVGIRESRRILGDLVLTADDILAQCTWPDSIGYGSFFVDIHHIDGPGMDHTVVRPPKGFKYQIPYRILVPRGVDNLLTAGRCVSVTHQALGSLRVMVQCLLMGEAAGLAAAHAIEEDTSPAHIDVPRLQAALRANRGILTEDDIPEPAGG